MSYETNNYSSSGVQRKINFIPNSTTHSNNANQYTNNYQGGSLNLQSMDAYYNQSQPQPNTR